jgi:hypothetical protein
MVGMGIIKHICLMIYRKRTILISLFALQNFSVGMLPGLQTVSSLRPTQKHLIRYWISTDNP